MGQLKTSADWAKELKEGIEILDPDGWDRKNFQSSWYEELVNKLEFERRFTESTVIVPPGWDGIWVN